MIYGVLGGLLQVMFSLCGLYKIKSAVEIVSLDMIVGIGSYGVSFGLWLWLLRTYPVSIIFPLILSVNLIATEVFGVCVLHETWSNWHGIALVFILTGIIALSVATQKTL